MLLRLRVRLPDRPGSLGQVARTLGVTGADIVQMVVLERVGGSAVDDFTVIWPSATPTDRILDGLGAIPGVTVDGVWHSVGSPAVGGADAELVGQVAASPDDGIATLVDAIPGLLSADWAAALVVSPHWAQGGGAARAGTDNPRTDNPRTDNPRTDNPRTNNPPAVAYASWRAPQPLWAPKVTPLRPRAFADADGVRYAAGPFGRAGLVMLAARGGGAQAAPQAPAFHVSEVDRLAQLVRACALVLGSRLDEVAAVHAASTSGESPSQEPWPVNTGVRFAAALDG
jgi:hypothetical protein